jgi:hypothetical protein
MLLWMLLWGMAGCKSGWKSDAVKINTDPRVQEKEIRGTKLMLTYMPPCMQPNGTSENDATEVVFKLNIFSDQLKEVKTREAGQLLSYGIDTLFMLTSGQDSVAPLLAQRIANGNLRGAEYLLIFERTALQHDKQVTLIFKDWLFTNVRMEFPVDIFKIDSISCGL